MELRYKIAGWVFVLVFFLSFALSPDGKTFLLKLKDLLFQKESEADIVVNIRIFVSVLVILITFLAGIAANYMISQIYGFIFFCFGGYNPRHYEPLKAYLTTNYSDNKDLSKLTPQSIYARFLHSYAEKGFVEWLQRRWTVFFTNRHVIIAFALGIILSWPAFCFFELQLPWTCIRWWIFVGILVLISIGLV